MPLIERGAAVSTAATVGRDGVLFGQATSFAALRGYRQVDRRTEGEGLMNDLTGKVTIKVGRPLPGTLRSDPVITLDPDAGMLRIGGGADGTILLTNRSGKNAILINQEEPSAAGTRPPRDPRVAAGPTLVPGLRPIGHNLDYGRIILNDAEGRKVLDLDAAQAVISFHAADGARTLVFDGTSSIVTLHDGRGARATVSLNGADGKLTLHSSAAGGPTIELSGEGGNATIGGNGRDGALTLRDARGTERLRLHSNEGVMSLHNSAAGARTIELNGEGGNATIGGNGRDGALTLHDGRNNRTITLHGNGGNIGLKGDLTLENADCAEDFDIANKERVEPSTVMVLSDDGALVPSSAAYDKRVAGVVSGGGDLKPGIVLDRREGGADRLPIALLGKVFCKVDARKDPIVVGDLLTTSWTPGHAMKATDPSRSFGSVLGKALRPLHGGTGTIPILVTLQ